MTIDMGINLPDSEREAIGRVGLAGLMAMACHKGTPSAKAMAAKLSLKI